MAENNNKPQVRVASIEVELGMSVQNKAGIWCKPTARMVLTVDGGTSPAQRAAIIKQGFDALFLRSQRLSLPLLPYVFHPQTFSQERLSFPDPVSISFVRR